jgi:hypothetical protein
LMESRKRMNKPTPMKNNLQKMRTDFDIEGD